MLKQLQQEYAEKKISLNTKAFGTNQLKHEETLPFRRHKSMHPRKLRRASKAYSRHQTQIAINNIITDINRSQHSDDEVDSFRTETIAISDYSSLAKDKP